MLTDGNGRGLLRCQMATRTTYNVDLMATDIAAKGWLPTDLARVSQVSDMTVSRFLRSQTQTAKTAHKLARALGYSVRRYLVAAKANRTAA